jgi:hypothetical protein
VSKTQPTVATVRNGSRRTARSVILPKIGDNKKMSVIETEVTLPTTKSACLGPTSSLTHKGINIEITPIEKIVLARS